jgi:hypothetical protein
MQFEHLRNHTATVLIASTFFGGVAENDFQRIAGIGELIGAEQIQAVRAEPVVAENGDLESLIFRDALLQAVQATVAGALGKRQSPAVAAAQGAVTPFTAAAAFGTPATTARIPIFVSPTPV